MGFCLYLYLPKLYKFWDSVCIYIYQNYNKCFGKKRNRLTTAELTKNIRKNIVFSPYSRLWASFCGWQILNLILRKSLFRGYSTFLDLWIDMFLVNFINFNFLLFWYCPQSAVHFRTGFYRVVIDVIMSVNIGSLFQDYWIIG